jgi:hypothetical protein
MAALISSVSAEYEVPTKRKKKLTIKPNTIFFFISFFSFPILQMKHLLSGCPKTFLLDAIHSPLPFSTIDLRSSALASSFWDGLIKRSNLYAKDRNGLTH